MTQCYCGSTQPYDLCCKPYHSGEKTAPTAEALMRSRFSAYITEHTNYLYKSWHSSTRPTKKALKKGEPINWTRLEIISTKDGNVFDQTGVVEFKAYYQESERDSAKNETTEKYLHERSDFVKENNQWVYLSGKLFSS